MTVVGIDFSSFAVDVVFLDGDNVRWRRIRLGDHGTAFDRAREIRSRMPARTAELWDTVDVIGIEDPNGPSSIVAPLKMIQGGILQALPRHALVQPIAPSKWRKDAGLSGRATKDDVAAFTHDELGLRPGEWPQDACDAYCIARAARHAATWEHNAA